MMKLTERMAEAARLSGVLEIETEWDRASEAVQAGTLERTEFDAVHARLLAAQDRYVAIMRELRAGV